MLSLIVPYFDLDEVYQSGLAYGWQKVDDGWYIMHHSTFVTSVKQYGDKKVFYSGEEEFFNVWYRYFTIDVDYLIPHNIIRRLTDERVKVILDRHEKFRLVRNGVDEVIITGIVEESCHNGESQSIIESIKRTCGVKMKGRIQNMGIVSWFDLPCLIGLRQPKQGMMYSTIYDSEPYEALRAYAERAAEINYLERMMCINIESRIDDIPELLWDLGLSDDIVSRVMLLCYAQLDNCPDSLMNGAMHFIHGVDPASWREWTMEETGSCSGLIAAMLKLAWNVGDATGSLADRLGWQVMQMKKKSKRRNPWERREIEGEETWD